MLKRWGLFLLTNILVVTTISIVLNLLGVTHYITAKGIDLKALATFALVWGFAGSIISLLISKQSAKWMMGVSVIDPKQPGQYRALLDTVYMLARKAELPKMPEVGIYDSAEVNAFATGPSKSNSLVAVTTGLLNSMTQEEMEGVLAHEISHIQNGDMVTMVLIQGVVNAFTIFVSRLAAWGIAQNVEEEKRGWVYPLVSIVLDLAIGFLGMILVMWFSRQREYRADAGSARLLGTKSKMIAALTRLAQLHGFGRDPSAAGVSDTYMISGHEGWFSSHPSIPGRIKALQGI